MKVSGAVVRPRGIPTRAIGIVALTLALAAGTRAWAGVWEPVGAMTQGRDSASATLLLDGSVLIAGGEGPQAGVPFDLLKSAERFDPKTNRFERTGAMATARLAHVAIRLGDGRVLVLGGLNAGSVALAAVEVFDPATNAFTSHGRLATARAGMTATLLADGRVLVVGGVAIGGGARKATAELYDPATGAGTPIASMAHARGEHTAVPLPDGRVVILGGTTVKGSPGVRLVEIYDPATGSFRVHGEIADRSGGQTATLLADGRILVTGGTYRATPSDAVQTLTTAEIYDPATGQSQNIGALTTPRYWHAAVALPGGDALVLGGCLILGDGPATKNVDRVNPATGAVTAAEPMAVPRGRPSVVLLLDGRVLVCGGFPAWGVAPTTHAEVYRP